MPFILHAVPPVPHPCPAQSEQPLVHSCAESQTPFKLHVILHPGVPTIQPFSFEGFRNTFDCRRTIVITSPRSAPIRSLRGNFIGIMEVDADYVLSVRKLQAITTARFTMKSPYGLQQTVGPKLPGAHAPAVCFELGHIAVTLHAFGELHGGTQHTLPPVHESLVLLAGTRCTCCACIRRSARRHRVTTHLIGTGTCPCCAAQGRTEHSR